VNDEAQNLALLDVVETNNPHVTAIVFGTARTDFAQDFGSRSGIEQRQLPQGPEVLTRFGIFAKFHSGDIALIQDVLDLSSDLIVRQRG
jgi:hypothetical protein